MIFRSEAGSSRLCVEVWNESSLDHDSPDHLAARCSVRTCRSIFSSMSIILVWTWSQWLQTIQSLSCALHCGATQPTVIGWAFEQWRPWTSTQGHRRQGVQDKRRYKCGTFRSGIEANGGVWRHRGTWGTLGFHAVGDHLLRACLTTVPWWSLESEMYWTWKVCSCTF